MTTTTINEQLGELYLETLCQNAYYEGAAGTIRDAVLGAAGCGGPADGPDLLRAAQKLTLDAMGLLERSIGRILTDWLRNRCDWARIDAFWDGTDRSDIAWVTEELDLQADRAWKTYFEHAGKPVTNLGIRWHHDLALAATFLQAAALLLKEVQGDA
ncbi:MAG: hypothetical protein RLZZ631_1302 [Cyanobacteriota bacterium]|jgi:hypothetical protein